MVITGGGPGIMQAANGEPASNALRPEHHPAYEQTSNHVVAHSDKLISFYYFCTSESWIS